jgi:hypothetical protein
LQRKINEQVKEGIKDLVHSRYADLERMLNENMGTNNTNESPANKRSKTQMNDHNTIDHTSNY